MKRSTFFAILSAIPFFRKKKSIAEQDVEWDKFNNLIEQEEKFLCNHLYTRTDYKCIFCGKDYE